MSILSHLSFCVYVCMHVHIYVHVCVCMFLSLRFFLFSVQLTLIQETMSSMQSEEDEALSVSKSVSKSVCLSNTERISILFAMQLSLIQKAMSFHP